MRLYAAADLHSRSRRLDLVEETAARLAPDLVVLAGDLTNYANPEPTMERLGQLPHEVAYVRGNSDLAAVDLLGRRYPRCRSLHLRRIAVGTVPVVGVSGTLPLPFATRLGLRERQLIRDVEGLVDERTVLVTHPPPRGVLDQALGWLPTGSSGLRDLVLRARPAVLVCGHIHEASGIATLGRTVVVNCSIGRRGAGAVIELGDGTPRVSLVP